MLEEAKVSLWEFKFLSIEYLTDPEIFLHFLLMFKSIHFMMERARF